MGADAIQMQLDRYVEQQQLLLEVTRQIANYSELEDSIPTIVRGVQRFFRADGVRLLLTQKGVHIQSYGDGPLSESMAQIDAYVINLVDTTGEVELTQSEYLGTGDAMRWPGTLAYLVAVPLSAYGTQQGVLWMGFDTPHALERSERPFLAILSGQAAIAIAHARAITASRKGREWLAAVLASTPDPVLVVDTDLHLQLMNPVAQTMFAMLAVDAIGYPLSDFAEFEQFAVLFKSGEGNGETQALQDYTTETGRCYQPILSEVRTERGDMTGWVLVLHDVTHFKRLNDNMSEFLTTVSHDMRSPLTVVKGYLDMMGMVGTLNERQNDYVERGIGGVIQMSDLVEKVLDAGKLDPLTGNYKLLREPCDVVEILQKVVGNLTEPASKKKLDLRHSVGSGIPILNLDRAMMTSAFTNLAENAVKYTPEGGHIMIDLQIADGALVFHVTDDGLGISPEDQKKLFERGVRVRRKEWKRMKGSGLGLFIVKNVAQRHGGDAWVDSVEGQGSTFTFAIPLEGDNLVGSKAEQK